MRIWSLYTKILKKDRKIRESLFTKADCFQCEYSYAEVYLGAKSKVVFAEDEKEVIMSYSVKDGIWVKIKRNKPYRVLFEYMDGVHLINDEIDREYMQLVTSLDIIKNRANNCHDLKVHDNVEEIVYKFLEEKIIGDL